MKKIFGIITSFMLIFSLTGCKGKNSDLLVQINTIYSFIISDSLILSESYNSIIPEADVPVRLAATSYSRSKVKEYISDLSKSNTDETVKSVLSNLEKIITYEEKIISVSKELPVAALLDLSTAIEFSVNPDDNVTKNTSDEVKKYEEDIKNEVEEYQKNYLELVKKYGNEKNRTCEINSNFIKPYLKTNSFILEESIMGGNYYGSMNIGEAQLEFFNNNILFLKPAIDGLKTFMNSVDKNSEHYKAANALYKGLDLYYSKYTKGKKELESRKDLGNVVQIGSLDKGYDYLDEYKKIVGEKTTLKKPVYENSVEPSKKEEKKESSEEKVKTDNSYESANNQDDTVNVPFNTDTFTGQVYTMNDIDRESLHANATSVLGSEPGFTYIARNARDGDPNTCWAEGVDGDGEGEYIEYVFSTEDPQNCVKINGIKVVNGCCNSKEAFYNNNRVKELKLTFDDNVMYVKLKDQYRTPQYIKFNKPVSFLCMSAEIMSVYKGDKYSDTCIAELMPY